MLPGEGRSLGYRAGHDTPPSLPFDVHHVPPPIHRKRVRVFIGVEPTNGFRGLFKRIIIRVHFHLGHNCDDLLRKSPQTQLLTEGPLKHEAEGTLGVGNK